MKKIKILIFCFLCSIASVAQTVTIGGMTTTAISQSGNEKIPMSGPGKPATTVLNLGQWALGVRLIIVEYGSALNQAATIQAAIDAAPVGSSLIFGGDASLSQIVKIETSISITKRLHFFAFGGITLQTISNIIILNFSGSAAGFSISGFRFLGNDTGAAQSAMSAGVAGYTIDRCVAIDFNLAGFTLSGTTTSPYTKSIISNSRAESCPGVGFSVISEYVSLVNNDAPGCGTGFKIAAGNLTLTDNSSNFSTTGITFDAATNTGKSSIKGGNFNHCTNSIVVNAADNGLQFIGVEAVTGAMNINVDEVRFAACHLAGTGNMNSKRVRFSDNVINVGGFVLSNKTSCTFSENYDLSGAAWTGS